jgi:hypothetical protein
VSRFENIPPPPLPPRPPRDSKYKRGYRFNDKRRALSTYRRLGAELPTQVDLTPHAPQIFDQGGTSSCVGHARARGLYVAAAAQGSPLPFIPSPVDLYRLALCYERGDWRTPLRDNGCDPVDTLDGAHEWGIRAIGPMARDGRYSDADPATITNNPTLADLRAARFARIADDSQLSIMNPVQDAMAALAEGRPVCIDVPGGSVAWQAYGPSSAPLLGIPDPTDHYVVLLGYWVDAGGVFFIGHNSWGTTWGKGGAFVADSSVVRRAFDLIACGGVLR